MDQQPGIMKWGKYLFALACAALPWAGLIPLSVYLFIALGIAMLASGNIKRAGLRELADPLSLLFFAFYALQLLGYILVPHDPLNGFSLEQKASFVFIPLLLSLCHKRFAGGWVTGVKWFIAGTVAACLYCLLKASYAALVLNEPGALYYHAYSSAVGANAIYLSLYIIVAMCLLMFYKRNGAIAISDSAVTVTVIFLCGNVLLLSSKLYIVVCGVLLFIMLSSSIKRTITKYAVSFLVLSSVLAFSFLDNPVSERYKEVDMHSYRAVLSKDDFTNYHFNGLDLRILLWRMGAEVLTEQDDWLSGVGGRAYHRPLNDKMHEYHLYAGDTATGDTGYINYNLHNQYMENTMQFGLAGLLVLLAIIACAIYQALRTHSWLLLLLTLIFSLAFLTESVLETQAGILLFTIFIYGEWKRSYAKDIQTK